MNTLALPDIPIITREPSWDEWVAYGDALARHRERLDNHIRNYRFIVAEWYEYGVEHWRRPAERIAREIGFDPETIANWAWVARHTKALRESSPRGDDGNYSELTYEHYRVLAAVKDPEQQRELADIARREKLSGARLAREVKRRRNGHDADGSMDSTTLVAGNRIERLINELIDEAAELLRSDDPIAQAQADVKFDCAARLRAAISK